jgi:hypothetical protein
MYPKRYRKERAMKARTAVLLTVFVLFLILAGDALTEAFFLMFD